MTVEPVFTIKIFYCYARKDRALQDKCDFTHILATFVKDIVAEPLVQKPV